MGHLRRAHSAAAPRLTGGAKRHLAVLIVLSLLSPSPAAVPSFAAAAAGPHPVLTGVPLRVYDELSTMLERAPSQPAGPLLAKARELAASVDEHPAVSNWVEERVARPLEGVAFWAAPGYSRMSGARDDLPRLKTLLVGAAHEAFAARAEREAVNPGWKTASARVNSILTGIHPAKPSLELPADPSAPSGAADGGGLSPSSRSATSTTRSRDSGSEPGTVENEALRELKKTRDELYEADKLAQRSDLSDAVSRQRQEELGKLDAEIRRLEEFLGSDRERSPGAQESEEMHAASLAALRRLLETFRSRPAPYASQPPGRKPEDLHPKEGEIADVVKKIEDLKKVASDQVGDRDTAAKDLAAADKTRALALRDRRSGKHMLEFRKNFARLAMVMDLTYSLSLLNSAEKALTGMQALVDKKIARLETQRKTNAESARRNEELKRKEAEWRKKVDEDLAEDTKNQKDFAGLADKTKVYVERVDAFRAEVNAVIERINARDRFRERDALTEYRRRLALIPGIYQRLKNGTGGTGVDMSLQDMKKKSQEVAADLVKLADAESQLATVPLEFAGILVVLVPGIPKVDVRDPSTQQILQILSMRKSHWQGLLREQQDILASVNRALDPGFMGAKPDDFGEPQRESLVLWLSEERERAARARQELSRLGGEIDELARGISAVTGTSLPPLAGRTPQELRTLLEQYADLLDRLSFPDTDPGFYAKMDKLALARRLPAMADNVALGLKAEAHVEIIDKALREVLPPAQARFTQAVASIAAVLRDIDADFAFVNAGYPTSELQPLIDRKRALVSSTLKPTLQSLQQFLDQQLIPFQEERVAKADPAYSGDGYHTLYSERIRLFERIVKAIERTLPWSLATDGAPEGDLATALANIDRLKAKFDAYTVLIADLKDQVRRRIDPNGTETEDVYGENMHYSLVVRRRVYTEEKTRRAGQFNARAAEINGMLAQLDSLSSGRHNLAGRFRLPADISPTGADSLAKLRRLVDDNILTDMANELKRLAEEADAAAGDADLGIGGEGGNIPTGTQPTPTLPPLKQFALTCLFLIERIVPSPNANGDSLAENTARYLFSDGVIESSNKNLNERIPIFSSFLDRGDRVLQEVFADFDADKAYARSDGSGGAALLDRKIRVYSRIRDTARDGADLFEQKKGWTKEGYDTVTDVVDLYGTLIEIYTKANEALDEDLEATRKIKSELDKALQDIRDKKREVMGWLKKLNDPHEPATERVMAEVSKLQDQTRIVLEKNVKFHEMNKQLKETEKKLEATLRDLGVWHKRLYALLDEVRDLNRLSPELAQKVSDIVTPGSSWLAAGGRGPQTIIIPRSGFSSFLQALFSHFEPESASRDIVALREEILRNPMALSQLLPNSKMIQMGEGADGFYLVYQSEFSTPHGLETSSQVTLGNVLRLWNSNISIIGHRTASPPDATNPPFGDQGITVQVETLEGQNWVNYLNITFHKFIQDIPSDLTVGSQAREARMMVFDDFALMLADGKLYFGAAGFADFALNNTSEKPYYYGGNFKASVKFTEVLSLNAEEQLLFAKDPRKFLQTVNLDFTKFDPDLNQDFVITAEGENKSFRRDKVGVGVNLAAALKSTDTFKVDFFFARTQGTDNINQHAVGALVMKGFTFDVAGQPLTTTVSAGGELGEVYNSYNGRISFDLPNQGLVLSASGKVLGDAETYFIELKKKFGTNSEAVVSYGSPYVGLNHRLTIGINTTFTLGELWRAATGAAAENLTGGEALKPFHERLEEFFKKDDPENPVLGELKRVFDADVGRRLVTVEIAVLVKDLKELRNAGAILDNTRVRAMIGFVTNPVSLGTAERATTGGFQAGVGTELTMSKTQRALVENKIGSIFAEGVKLQMRLLELTKAWQAVLSDLVQTRWEAALAQHMAELAPDAVLKAEAKALWLDAQARHRQAALRYNALTGRGPDEAVFFALNPNDLDRFFKVLERALSSPERLSFLAASVRHMPLPEESLNLIDWIPWVERLTFYAGVQLQDILSSQILGLGVSVRLPVYDPNSSYNDKALLLRKDAAIYEMASALRQYTLRAQSEKLEADSLDAQARDRRFAGAQMAQEVWDAIRAYRNGLLPQDELWRRFHRWHWSLATHMTARSQAALKTAWSLMDFAYAKAGEIPLSVTGHRLDEPKTLEAAMALAEKNSLTMESLAMRSQAARELMEAAANRITKVSVDVTVGVNLTASGIALLPVMGLTGLGLFPILNVDLKPSELRALDVERTEAEAHLYSRLGAKVSADLALQLFEAILAFKTAAEAVRVYEDELLPSLESGGGLAYDQARAELQELTGRRQQSLAMVNYLLGRPLGMPLRWDESLDAMVEKLRLRFGKESPLAARRDVLASRVKMARSVEIIVDKNLKGDTIRFEPISLIGRSLGRLINALGGAGMASPEMMALARYETLKAEQDLRAFEEAAKSLRARLRTEIALARRRIGELSGRTDPRSQLERTALGNRVLALKATLFSYGGSEDDAEPPASGLPPSYAELRARLADAFAAEAFSPQASTHEPVIPGEPVLDARGTMRAYYLKQSLAKDPISKHFIEGWVEVRLRSAATPPEALIALANLQQERADQLFLAEQNAARAKAEILLARIRLNAGLLKGARGELARQVRQKLERDFGEVAARLSLGPEATLEGLLQMLPEEGVRDAESAARHYVEEASRVDFDFLKRTLFAKGMPDEVRGTGDQVLQLKATMIAERMSYKGFSPMLAFGIFRGQWVAGFFLEAPNPVQIQKGLENILTEALKKELESQDRLRALGLRLHQLMASVADKIRLVEAQHERLMVTRRALMGTAARLSLNMAADQELAAAAVEVGRAHEDFVETIAALQMDFAVLVTELEAIGQGDRAFDAPGLRLPEKPRISSERTAEEKILAYISGRMTDEEFERQWDGFLAAVPEALRAEMRERISALRRAATHEDWARHEDFTSGEKLMLLTKVDLAGRREKVEATLRKILGELAKAEGDSWNKVMGFLADDLKAREESVRTSVAETSGIRQAMRESFWNSGEAPAEVNAAYHRLSRLAEEADRKRVEAIAKYLENAEDPTDYLLKDAALDEYLKALIAYDAEAVAAFSSEAVRNNPHWARMLDSLFGARASFDRRRDTLRYGRGILAIDASIDLGERRLAALRAAPDDRRDVNPASESLAGLKAMRERWIARPADVDPLYLVRGSNGPEWYTAADLARGKVKGSTEKVKFTDIGGRTFKNPEGWVAPTPPASAEEALKEGFREVHSGVDVRRERLRSTEERWAERRRREDLASALSGAEVVMTKDAYRSTGRVTGAITLERLRELEKQGRVLYYSARPDRRNLRPALHPLSALSRLPSELIIMVQVWGPNISRDKYPSFEALEGSEWATAFERVEFGSQGLEALIDEAKLQELEARRAGWLALKTGAYAYAMEGTEVVEVYMGSDELKAAVERAGEADSPSRKWTFRKVSDLRIGLDARDRVVRVESPGFEETLGADAPVRWVTREVLALIPQEDGSLRIIHDEDELVREGKTWGIEDQTGEKFYRTDKDISPIHRVKNYIDAKGRPVTLGHRYLARRLDEAKDEKGDVNRWGYMPPNWLNIVLELPRGIVKTPIELLTGRDPNQEGYIGMLYMYQTEGGSTERRGILGTIIRVVDIFEIFPDHVGRFYDPSQFPKRVDNDSPLLPGEWQHEKNPRTPDGKLNIHYGLGWFDRAIRWAGEDQTDVKGRVLSSFSGGVRRRFVESVRGRAGNYPDSKLDNQQGAPHVDEALRRTGDRMSSDGRAEVEAKPGHIAVDRVSAEIEIRIGARQHADRRKAYEDALKKLREEKGADAETLPDPAAERRALDESSELRRGLRLAADAAAPAPGYPAVLPPYLLPGLKIVGVKP